MTEESALSATLLHELHVAHDAKFGPFAGYEMPLQYEAGAVAEHRHTRRSASIFDVSHMRAIDIYGNDIAPTLETLVPGGIRSLTSGRLRYTFFTNEAGGILDDLIVNCMEDRLRLVVNASRAEHDIAHLQQLAGVTVEPRFDLHVLAVQGPQAAAALADHGIDLGELTFMDGANFTIDGVDVWVSRSGYTGEDGAELLLPSEQLVGFTEALLADERVEFAGLVARDSLRLEAGLCLYGSDLDETTTPVEAQLMWAIPKRRREAGDYPGADVVTAQLKNGVDRKRVGIGGQKRPVRGGSALSFADGGQAGIVTSGGFGTTIDAPVAMGYVETEAAATGTALVADVRGKDVDCEVVDLPFVAANYVR